MIAPFSTLYHLITLDSQLPWGKRTVRRQAPDFKIARQRLERARDVLAACDGEHIRLDSEELEDLFLFLCTGWSPFTKYVCEDRFILNI